MFPVQNFGVFALAVFLINITPGSTFLAVTSKALTGGVRPAIIISVGASAALLVYAILSWLGLSVLITGSKLVFNMIRYAGAAYLLYCGIMAIIRSFKNADPVYEENHLQNFKKGFLINILNPFSLVFFLSLIPQFADPASHNPSEQILFMGLWISFSALVVNISLSLLIGTFSKSLAGKPLFWKYQGIITGAFFIWLSVRFAFFFR